MRVTSSKDLAAAVRGRRISLGWTQAAVATRAGVSRPWVSQLEGGKRSAEFGLVLRVLDALRLSLEIVEASQDVTSVGGRAVVDLDAVLDRLRDR
ncbi:MAG: helix-turn-helix domain-containing protein [Candidatus Dormiibacterota bacterium]